MIGNRLEITDIKRVSVESLGNISDNILNASKDLYDRLDHDKPTISASPNNKGQITIEAQDLKILKYSPSKYSSNDTLDFRNYDPETSEPANNGIVAYQITQSAEEPTTNWITVDKTETLNITTDAVKSNGTYYAWVLDVGGNVASAQVEVSSVASKPPEQEITDKQKKIGNTISNLVTDVYENHQNDFTYSSNYGVENGKATMMNEAIQYRNIANKAGVKYTALKYTRTREEAESMLKNGGLETIQDKFFVDEKSFLHLMVYHAIGGVEPEFETITLTENDDVKQTLDILNIGDIVTTHKEYTNGSVEESYFMCIEKLNDDDSPYKWRIAYAQDDVESPIKFDLKNFKEEITSVDTKKIYISKVERVSRKQAEKISNSILKASTDFYDRLDHNKPTIEVLPAREYGALIIRVYDPKIEKFNKLNIPTEYLSFSKEPANNGIIAVAFSRSKEVEPTFWFTLPGEIPKNEAKYGLSGYGDCAGIGYEWTLDIGGNTSFTKVNIPVYKDGYYISIEMPTTQEATESINAVAKSVGTITKKNGDTLGSSELVGTGMTVKDSNDNTSTVVVTGDITGDGSITTTDILKLKRNIVEIDELDEAESMAADVNYNNKISTTDLFQMKKAMVGMPED